MDRPSAVSSAGKAVMLAVVVLVAVVVAVVGAVPTAGSSGAREESFCFISHGCWGGAGLPVQRQVANVMGKTAETRNARFVIAAGDNVYTKGVTSVDDPKFKAVFEDVYNHPSLLGIPFITALGNHDYRGNFWAQVNYTKKSSRWFMPHPYFERRFPEASLTVIVIDTPLLERCWANKGKARWQDRCWDHERQHAWLNERLAAAAADGIRWRVVVGHYPMYANGPHINHDWLIALVETAMTKHDAQMYINADNHYLQVAKKDGRYFFNSGGGAGYLPHKRTDKGYHRDPHTTFEEMTMGIGLHCIEQGGEVLRTSIISAAGKELYTFDAAPAAGSHPYVGEKQLRVADAQSPQTNAETGRRPFAPTDGAGDAAAPHHDHHSDTFDVEPVVAVANGGGVSHAPAWLLLVVATAGLIYTGVYRGGGSKRPGRR